MTRELSVLFSCTLVVPADGLISAQARQVGIPVIVQDIPLVTSLYLALPHLHEEISLHQQQPSWRELILLLDREQPDAILVNTCVHPLPAIAGKGLGIPVVWSVMEVICNTAYRTEAATVIDAHADIILGISEATLAPFRPLCAASKMTLIPPSWHQAELQPERWTQHRANRRKQLGLVADERVVGYISSSIFEGKGLEHFMEMAVRTVRLHPKSIYLIVGNPVDQLYFEKCLDIARRQGLMERVRWLRFEQQVATVYPAMDILVVPSLLEEGFGMTALEGMVFGKAVVVYGSGGLAEIGRMTGNDGYVAQTGDIEGLAANVSSLLGDERVMHAVGDRNAREANAVFGISAYRERLQRLADTLKQRSAKPLKLIQGSKPDIYLYERGTVRRFRSLEAFIAAGYRLEEVQIVPDSVLAAWPQGVPIGEHRPQAKVPQAKVPQRVRKRAVARRGKQPRSRRKVVKPIRGGQRKARVRRGKAAGKGKKRQRRHRVS